MLLEHLDRNLIKFEMKRAKTRQMRKPEARKHYIGSLSSYCILSRDYLLADEENVFFPSGLLHNVLICEISE